MQRILSEGVSNSIYITGLLMTKIQLGLWPCILFFSKNTQGFLAEHWAINFKLILLDRDK